jgi:hypothetical protein
MSASDQSTINGNVIPATIQEVQRGDVAAGQRRVNLIWEVTQAIIALSVVIANIAVAIHIGFSDSKTAIIIPQVLTDSLFLVIGFYFGRTNHASVGGVGYKPPPEGVIYQGR